uniref:Uncharacterized protein C11orf24 homolog n=1 Tax=Nicotiana sylvestris TaxID=4096 RepID=A0A1U7XSI3_NICSY|nr:PREDICTED: uncharacterized protein C11orf24 homolog [Nicotiana sylvestris]
MCMQRNQGGRAGTSSVGDETAESGTAASAVAGSASAAVGSASVPAAGSSAAAGSASVPAAGSSSVAGSAATPSTMESVTFTPPIIDPSTQQSANVAGGPKRKTNEPRRGGANAGFKRPKAAGYGVLFDSSGTVIQRSGTTDRVVVHNPSTLISSAPTNIELRFKPPRLQWKGKAAVTQRQLQEQSYRRTKSTTTTQATQLHNPHQEAKPQQTLIEVLN